LSYKTEQNKKNRKKQQLLAIAFSHNFSSKITTPDKNLFISQKMFLGEIRVG